MKRKVVFLVDTGPGLGNRTFDCPKEASQQIVSVLALICLRLVSHFHRTSPVEFNYELFDSRHIVRPSLPRRSKFRPVNEASFIEFGSALQRAVAFPEARGSEKVEMDGETETWVDQLLKRLTRTLSDFPWDEIQSSDLPDISTANEGSVRCVVLVGTVPYPVADGLYSALCRDEEKTSLPLSTHYSNARIALHWVDIFSLWQGLLGSASQGPSLHANALGAVVNTAQHYSVVINKMVNVLSCFHRGTIIPLELLLLGPQLFPLHSMLDTATPTPSQGAATKGSAPPGTSPLSVYEAKLSGAEDPVASVLPFMTESCAVSLLSAPPVLGGQQTKRATIQMKAVRLVALNTISPSWFATSHPTLLVARASYPPGGTRGSSSRDTSSSRFFAMLMWLAQQEAALVVQCPQDSNSVASPEMEHEQWVVLIEPLTVTCATVRTLRKTVLDSLAAQPDFDAVQPTAHLHATHHIAAADVAVAPTSALHCMWAAAHNAVGTLLAGLHLPPPPGHHGHAHSDSAQSTSTRHLITAATFAGLEWVKPWFQHHSAPGIAIHDLRVMHSWLQYPPGPGPGPDLGRDEGHSDEDDVVAGDLHPSQSILPTLSATDACVLKSVEPLRRELDIAAKTQYYSDNVLGYGLVPAGSSAQSASPSASSPFTVTPWHRAIQELDTALRVRAQAGRPHPLTQHQSDHLAGSVYRGVSGHSNTRSTSADGWGAQPSRSATALLSDVHSSKSLLVHALHRGLFGLPPPARDPIRDPFVRSGACAQILQVLRMAYAYVVLHLPITAPGPPAPASAPHSAHHATPSTTRPNQLDKASATKPPTVPHPAPPAGSERTVTSLRQAIVKRQEAGDAESDKDDEVPLGPVPSITLSPQEFVQMVVPCVLESLASVTSEPLKTVQGFMETHLLVKSTGKLRTRYEPGTPLDDVISNVWGWASIHGHGTSTGMPQRPEGVSRETMKCVELQLQFLIRLEAAVVGLDTLSQPRDPPDKTTLNRLKRVAENAALLLDLGDQGFVNYLHTVVVPLYGVRLPRTLQAVYKHLAAEPPDTLTQYLGKDGDQEEKDTETLTGSPHIDPRAGKSGPLPFKSARNRGTAGADSMTDRDAKHAAAMPLLGRGTASATSTAAGSASSQTSSTRATADVFLTRDAKRRRKAQQSRQTYVAALEQDTVPSEQLGQFNQALGNMKQWFGRTRTVKRPSSSKRSKRRVSSASSSSRHRVDDGHGHTSAALKRPRTGQRPNGGADARSALTTTQSRSGAQSESLAPPAASVHHSRTRQVTTTPRRSPRHARGRAHGGTGRVLVAESPYAPARRRTAQPQPH